MRVTVDKVLTAAKALVDAVSHDDNGSMVAGQWMGGNGGLLSRATIKTADHLRVTLDTYRKAIEADGIADTASESGEPTNDGGAQ